LVTWQFGELVNGLAVRARVRVRLDRRRVASSSRQLTKSPTRQFGALDRGFTMIELLVVVSLIVILATMGMTQYRNSVIHAREATLHEDLFRLRDAIDQYYADKGQYPSTLDALVSDGYVRKLPVDPFTNNNTSWQTVPAEPDPNNPVAEPGVYDVKSGSDATALDGTKYSEW
jgi:general secretion pathway protein G